jgi:hypothetical protein
MNAACLWLCSMPLGLAVGLYAFLGPLKGRWQEGGDVWVDALLVGVLAPIGLPLLLWELRQERRERQQAEREEALRALRRPP